MGESAYLENKRRQDEAAKATSEYSLFSEVLGTVREVSQTAADIYGTWVNPTEAVQQQDTGGGQDEAPQDEYNIVMDSIETSQASSNQQLLILAGAALVLILVLK